MYHARQEVVVYKLVLLTVVAGNASFLGTTIGLADSASAWGIIGALVLGANLPILALMTLYARWAWKTSWKDAFWKMTRLLCVYILALGFLALIIFALALCDQ